MRIAKINTNLSFKSRVIYENSVSPLSPDTKKYIDDFEEGKIFDYKSLGEGVTSRAYYSPINNFVIKQNKENKYIREKERYEMGSLGHENLMLSYISPKVKNTQRAVGYVETEKGGKFLLSTLVQGKPADSLTNPFTDKHIDRLLRNLYRLDKSMIIHSDLSRPNLLLDDENNVSLIDYQWADRYDLKCKFDEFGLKNATFPTFESPNNATMFESAALAGYARSLPEYRVKDFLKNYYQNKAHYLNKNIKRLEEFNQGDYGLENAIEFDKARTRAYTNINDSVLEAEILKMNILNLHRRQFSCHDTNKVDARNILRAIPLQIRAKECADALSNLEENSNMDSTYANYMQRFGKFWQSNMENWYVPTLFFIFKLVSGKTRDPAKIYFPETFNDFRGLDIVNIGQKQARKLKDAEDTLVDMFLKANRNKYNVDNAFQDRAFEMIRNTLKKA